MNDAFLAKIREAMAKFEGEQADPRILVTGSTGVGKSSLINAVFGRKLHAVNTVESTTRTFTSNEYQLDERTKVIITDSPGYGEVGHDQEYSESVVKEAASAHVVTLVLKADDKGYARDLDIIRLASRDPKFSIEKPLLIALNQIDKVKPSREWKPPYDTDARIADDDPEKLRNLKEKLQLVRSQFRDAAGSRSLVIVPTMVDEGDSYGVDAYKMAIFQALPEVAKFRFARIAKLADSASAEVIAQLDAAADDVITAAAAAAAAAVALNPIPASDFIALSGIQVGMVIKIGALYGKSLSFNAAVEALTTMGAGFAARSLFQGLISLLPVGKQLIGPPYAAATTHGMGKVAKSYFKRGTVLSADDLKSVVEAEWKRRGG